MHLQGMWSLRCLYLEATVEPMDAVAALHCPVGVEVVARDQSKGLLGRRPPSGVLNLPVQI